MRIVDMNASLREATRDLQAQGSAPDVSLQAVRDDAGWSWVDPGGRVVARIDTDSDPTERAVGVLTQIGLDHDEEHLHLHAALLENNGSGLLLCGPSGAGKTTLAAALLELGYGYLTDEAVPLSPGSRTLDAYPKPLTLKGFAIWRFGGSGATGSGSGQRLVRPATDLGRICRRITCEHVVFPTYRADANTSVVEVSRPDALCRLLGETLDTVRFGPEALDVLADLVSRASCWSIQYSALDEAARIVNDLMQTRPQVVPWTFGELGVRFRSVVIAGKYLTIDTERRSVETRDAGDVPSIVDCSPVQPPTPAVADVHTELVLRALERLRSARIDSVVCGDAVALHDGPRSQLIAEPLETTLLVANGALGLARSCTADLPLGSARVRVDDDLVSGTRGPSLGYADVVESARCARFQRIWHLGLGPAHRLIDACLRFRRDPTDRGLAQRVVDRGQLPEREVERALTAGGRVGLNDEIERSVIAAAHLIPGTSPTLARCIRRRGSSSLRRRLA